MRAAATAQVVFDRNPGHPGAAHYVIHPFDDPVHAPLGLEAANAYADIAPNAAHAQHMTSHIFVAMGLWEREVEANIRASDTEDAERAREGEEPNVCGHYSSWLHYAHLQLGETAEAEALMDRCHGGITTGADDSWGYFTSMRARHVADTGDWALAQRWTVPLERLPAGETGSGYAGPRLQYRITNALADLRRDDAAAARALIAEARPVRRCRSISWRGLSRSRTRIRKRVSRCCGRRPRPRMRCRSNSGRRIRSSRRTNCWARRYWSTGTARRRQRRFGAPQSVRRGVRLPKRGCCTPGGTQNLQVDVIRKMRRNLRRGQRAGWIVEAHVAVDRARPDFESAALEVKAALLVDLGTCVGFREDLDADLGGYGAGFRLVRDTGPPLFGDPSDIGEFHAHGCLNREFHDTSASAGD